jgi:poly-gamma-glutamate capsule biosynthesis protein CapA/YwtB (metallophosphatase superfamily)
MKGFFLPMKQHRFLLLLTTYLYLINAGCINPTKQPAKKITKNNTVEIPADTVVRQVADTVITIAAVGDMMLGTSYPDSTHLPADSGKQSFKYALKDLREADIAFGNLEGVLLDTGAPAEFKLKFKSKPYLFKMPESYGGILKDAGFDIISLGNNHSNDFSLKGRKQTINILDSLGIHHAGLKISPTKVFTKNGIKYGFCAFSPNSQTVSLLDIKGVKAIIEDLKHQVDIVIVSFHGGGEGVEFEHLSCTSERYKGERRGNVNTFAHAAVDAGADVILGHGPHVSRALEVYKKRLIAYSLGNFCTHTSVSVSGVCGLAALLKVRVNKNGHFLSGQIISYKQSHAKGLTPDPLNKAAARIKYLTETDLDQAGLSISASGELLPLSANND